jgi:hypothetical protein
MAEVGEDRRRHNEHLHAHRPGGAAISTVDFTGVYQRVEPRSRLRDRDPLRHDGLINLLDIHYVQSNNVMTLTHQTYPQQELRRVSDNELDLDGAFVCAVDRSAGRRFRGDRSGQWHRQLSVRGDRR